MTGFGRAEGVVRDRKVTVEVRSLNGRQLDLLVKLPSICKDRETELRQWAGERVVRGKAEVVVAGEPLTAAKKVHIDRELVRVYHDQLRTIAREVAPETTTDLFAHALRMAEPAFMAAERMADAEWAGVKVLIEAAITAFESFRRNEGQRLMDDLALRVGHIGRLLDEAETLDNGRTERTRERLRTKLAELRADVDEDRFEQELVYYLEKLDFTEEKVRLRAHLAYFIETMDGDGEQGRKLGFIAQEMGREINTLGSKANDATIQRSVVLMKDELEKIKEQVLNVL